MGQVLTVGDDEARHTLLGHLKGKIIGVEVFSFQSEEDSVLLDLAAISGYFVGLQIVLIYSLNSAHGICFLMKEAA